MINDDVKLGHNVTIPHPHLVNIYGCEIGDNTFIGPFVEITKDVIIRCGCTVESHSYICSGVLIEDDVFIGHGVMFVNDLFPWPGKKVKYLHTTIKKNAIIGTNTTIIGGITIGRHAVLGAGSVATKDVPDHSIAAGNPARIIRQFNNNDELYSYMISRQSLR